MKNVAKCAMALLMLVIGQSLAALAQTDPCPAGFSNDQCDQWRFERADKQLADLVRNEIAQLGKRSTDRQWQGQAKKLLTEAQEKWAAFRAAECKARSTINVISARTREGKTAACLLDVTQRRIAEIKR